MTEYQYQGDYHPDAGKLLPNQFSARGNYGELICDVATGKVVKYLADTDACPEENYADIEALDIAAFETETGRKVEAGYYDIIQFDLILRPGVAA